MTISGITASFAEYSSHIGFGSSSTGANGTVAAAGSRRDGTKTLVETQKEALAGNQVAIQTLRLLKLSHPDTEAPAYLQAVQHIDERA